MYHFTETEHYYTLIGLDEVICVRYTPVLNGLSYWLIKTYRLELFSVDHR